MQYIISFSRPTIDKNREGGPADKPITIWPGGKRAYGLSVRGEMLVVYDYDPSAEHRAYVKVDGEIECRDFILSAEEHRRNYLIYTMRDAVKRQKKAPCLTMKYRSNPSQYAYKISLSHGGNILYTTGRPIINGVRLWIESSTPPIPKSEWYCDAYFRKCCGYKPRR